MPYIPNSSEDQKKMLEIVGLSDLADLFASIPKNLRLTRPLNLPEALAEPELVEHLDRLARKNRIGELSFLGGGIYNHYIPAVIWTLVMRPEFATAYTPYQAEVAQGTLQVIYEFQTHLCRLTGLDVANASMYDGATAMAEAALLAVNHTGRKKIVVSETVSPLYIDVLKAAIGGRDLEVVILPRKGNSTDYGTLNNKIDDGTACLILAQPNYFGALEEIETGEKAIHAAGGLFIQVFDPISLGILKPPAEYSADIAVGEGQSLGIPRNFGGPLLGLFTCRQEFVRKLPGRLVARTLDVEGKIGFVLTLQTREQHIRRDKATSNICTNEALCATAATIYMSLMGKQGLSQVARLSTERAHYLAERIAACDNYSLWGKRPFFKEFVIETPVPAARIVEEMMKHEIAAGIDLKRFYSELDRHLLVAVTETVSYDDCDRFVSLLKSVSTDQQETESAYVK